MTEEYATPEETEVLRNHQRRLSKGPQPQMECGCGHKAPLRWFYKCLYCEVYFCTPCAEEHFGMTRKQYREQQQEQEASNAS